MLEVFGQQIPGKDRHVPHDKAIARDAPRDDRIGGGIVHHLVRLREKWRGGIRRALHRIESVADRSAAAKP